MRNVKAIIFVFVLVTASACNSSAQPLVADKLPSQTPVANNSSVLDANALCSRVSEIKQMPFKGEKVDDAAYNSIIEAGEAVLPCLIEKVADTTPMQDPRGIPGPTDTRVGDVAYFLIVEIANLDFTELLPAKVQQEFKTEGVYSYHWFVSKRKNRLQLQTKLKEWYEQKNGVKK